MTHSQGEVGRERLSVGEGRWEMNLGDVPEALKTALTLVSQYSEVQGQALHDFQRPVSSSSLEGLSVHQLSEVRLCINFQRSVSV